MAKKSKSRTGGVIASLSRALSFIWRSFAKTIGAFIRVVTRGARDLEPEHRRDGIGLLFLIVALIAAATTWWHLDNGFGRAAHAFFYGGFGRIGRAHV